MNIPPVAATTPADHLRGTGARINAGVGAGFPNGDPVTYFFRWGLTTSYGKLTTARTLGKCPPGLTGPQYCQTPAVAWVAETLKDLKPCTKYHYQVQTANDDGTVVSLDMAFNSGFFNPVRSVALPRKVGHGKKYVIKVRTRGFGRITVQLIFNGKTVGHKSFKGRKHAKSLTFTAPSLGGTLIVKITGRLSCGRQTIVKWFQVEGPASKNTTPPPPSDEPEVAGSAGHAVTHQLWQPFGW